MIISEILSLLLICMCTSEQCTEARDRCRTLTFQPSGHYNLCNTQPLRGCKNTWIAEMFLLAQPLHDTFIAGGRVIISADKQR